MVRKDYWKDKEALSTGNTLSFKRGETICLEGMRGRVAWKIISGDVQLFKHKLGGRIPLEVLSAGQYVGESALDKGLYDTSAQAVHDVVLQPLDRERFKKLGEWSAENRRMQKAYGAKILPNSKSASTWQRWMGALVGEQPVANAGISVGVVMPSTDNGKNLTKFLIDSMNDLGVFNVRGISASGALSHKAPDLATRGVCIGEARKMLNVTRDDLLVWVNSGESIATDENTYELHFISRRYSSVDHAGLITGLDRLSIPTRNLSGEWMQLVHLMCLCAIVPDTSKKSNIIKGGLDLYLDEGVRKGGLEISNADPLDNALLYSCIARVSAFAWYRSGAGAYMEYAISRWKNALDILSVDENSTLEVQAMAGLIHKNIGSILAAIGKKKKDMALLMEARTHIETAAPLIPRRYTPKEWAMNQHRMGQILYSIHALDEEASSNLLKLAIKAWYEAVQIFNRVDSPERWREIMMAYVRAAQILGSHTSDVDLLQKNVNACREILETHPEHSSPLRQAELYNTLGSALFMLGRLSGNSNQLEDALVAFHQAHTVYIQQNSPKMVQVLNKNLKRTREMLATLHDMPATQQLLPESQPRKTSWLDEIPEDNDIVDWSMDDNADGWNKSVI